MWGVKCLFKASLLNDDTFVSHNESSESGSLMRKANANLELMGKRVEGPCIDPVYGSFSGDYRGDSNCKYSSQGSRRNTILGERR
jgi:hypothetical protein